MTTPHYRLTQHALEQAEAMGVLRDEVIDCIEHPLLTYDSNRSAGSRVAKNARLAIPYNPTTGEVITVLWASQEWLPDRHLPPEEQPVSGWINLTAKEAERLLESWGFIVKEDKGTTKLWAHPGDEQGRLIPFTTPMTRKGNGKGSYRSAAQAVGVSMPEFLRGPTAELREAMTTLADLEEAFDESKPDPLGLGRARRESALTHAAEVADVLQTNNRKREALTPVQRQAYDAIFGEPLTAAEVGLLIDRGKTTTNEILNHLVNEGLAVMRISTPEDGLGTGRPRYIYRAGGPGTPIPPLHRAAPLSPSPAPVVEVVKEPEEAPVQAVPDNPMIDLTTSAVLAGSIGAPAPEKLFTATGTPWPTGGLLIQDEDGVYYVARKLVEEGR